MTSDDSATVDSSILDALSGDQRLELEERHFVKDGGSLVWIELEGELRREKLSSLYYIRTAKGVFRVSRINGRVVEV